MKQLIAKLTDLKNEEGLSHDEIKALDRFIDEITPATGFLKVLSTGHLVKAVDGSYDRGEFEKMFPNFFDDTMEDSGCGEDDDPTEEMPFDRHNLVKDATFMQVFDEVSTLVGDNDKLFFTKRQIITIFYQNPELFYTDGRGHFFFYKNKKGERFVFGLRYRYNGWSWRKSKLTDGHTWYATDGRIFFIPK